MVIIEKQALNPMQIIGEFQVGLDMSKSGACTQFTGYMRDFNNDDSVTLMTLEYYPGMTEKALDSIETEACKQWPLNAVLIAHRVGDLNPADPIVVVAAWSAHRNAAFAACRFLIEELKHKAPFWKKEVTTDGERWVAENSPAELK